MRRDLTSRKLFARAQKYLVGGVNSPVRSFRGVGRESPLFISRARGSKIYDVDKNEYIDYVCSWGASILGSADPRVVRAVKRAASRGLNYGAATNQESDLAERIHKSVPSVELLRLVSSGTEAAMSAVRVARAYTKRSKIIKFDGCYHGHADAFLVRAGSGLATFSISDSAGVPDSIAEETLVSRFNDLESVGTLLERNKVAAIIVEPVAGNMGVVPPSPGFLTGLRKLCDESGAILIFDEVITGFRISRGGAQSLYAVKPDLTCLGKVIGGGMNLAAYGGRREIMELVAPLGPVYQAGTLAGNPLAVAAGIETLDALGRGAYSKLEVTSRKLEDGVRKTANESRDNLITQRVGSMIGLFFLKDEGEEETGSKTKALSSHDDIKNRCSTKQYSRFFAEMLGNGIYLAPSAFETTFVSTAHSDADVERTILAVENSFRKMQSEKSKKAR